MMQTELNRLIAEHKLWLRDNSTGNQLILNGEDLSKLNLRNKDLKHVIFKSVNFSDSDFTETDLYNAQFNSCQLSRTKLIKAEIRNVSFRHSNLLGVDLTDVIANSATIGDGHRIQSLQVGKYSLCILDDMCYGGCIEKTLDEWLDWDDPISDSDREYLENVTQPFIQSVLAMRN